MKYIVLLLFVVLLSCARRDSSNQLQVSGRIEADEVDLAFKLSGRLTEILVREGDSVKRGQVLARISGTQEEIRLKEAEARWAGAIARLNQTRLSVKTLEQRLNVTRLQEGQANIDAKPRVQEAQARLAALKAELARAQSDAAMVRSDAARYARLAEKGSVAHQLAEQYESRVKVSSASVESVAKQIEAAESSVGVSEASLENAHIRAAEGQVTQSQIAETRAAVQFAEAEVGAAQAGLDRANADIAELTVAAPIDGRIITRSAEPGRVVSPGQVILTVIDPANLYLRGFIPVSKSDVIKVGQQATVSLPSNASVEAEVTRIDPQAMFTPENTYFKEQRVKQVVGIKLRLKDNPDKAKVGMPADALIKIS